MSPYVELSRADATIVAGKKPISTAASTPAANRTRAFASRSRARSPSDGPAGRAATGASAAGASGGAIVPRAGVAVDDVVPTGLTTSTSASSMSSSAASGGTNMSAGGPVIARGAPAASTGGDAARGLAGDDAVGATGVAGPKLAVDSEVGSMIGSSSPSSEDSAIAPSSRPSAPRSCLAPDFALASDASG